MTLTDAELGDAELLAQVRPSNWRNPAPKDRYHLVVLGAGTAGLVTAAIGAALGAKVALVEKNRLGGDCLNSGCVPSKALLRSARAWKDAARAEDFGISVPDHLRSCDFSVVMAGLRKLRARLGVHDSAWRFRELGVDVFLGAGTFSGPETVQVGDASLRFARAAICTGSRPAVPSIAGLEHAGFRTNDTVFDLVSLPPRVAVIGGGPIGCELAQAFARFRSHVTLFEQTDRILSRDDAEAASLVASRMRSDGVNLCLGVELQRAERRGDEKLLHYRERLGGGGGGSLVVDEIIVGAGRVPNVEGLGLERVGVEFGPMSGVEVDHRLRTTNPRIFAAGDVCSRFKFTHVADAHAQILVQNALFPHPLGLGYARADRLVVPWCTYTDPELAHVGLSPDEAERLGIPIETFTVPLAEVDRAILDREEEGFGRIHVRRGTDRVVGATIVAAHAGELISEFTLLMRSAKGLRTLASTIHPYPTQAELARKLAIAWRKSTFTATKRRIVSVLLRMLG